jgi:hypothetical protein
MKQSHPITDKPVYPVCLLPVLLFFGAALFANAAFGAPLINRGPTIHPEAKLLIRQAKELHSRGLATEAQALVVKARLYSPAIPDPFRERKNLSLASEKANSGMLSRAEMISLYSASPSILLKPLFEQHLRQNPSDGEIRRILLEMAEQSGDHRQSARHRSIIGGGDLPAVPWGKVLLSIILLLLILWQIWQILHDIRRSLAKARAQTVSSPPPPGKMSSK